jgi:hypothetical protein
MASAAKSSGGQILIEKPKADEEKIIEATQPFT